ncbi:integrating conjugative element protein [Pseudomonas sp. LRF_L74]|uniref:integrating conjugative element protein n=1 Tax=Pseudomonas sp. LRF_L74 TaxID=3369422 RepID=UPI003F616926
MRADVQQALIHEDAMLPVKSQVLSPGKLQARKLTIPGLPPFFLVGADEFSIQWLRARAADLRSINAAGLAVEVHTPADLARIRATAPGLMILPVNGDDIARRLQIEHYPVLITGQTLEQ